MELAKVEGPYSTYEGSPMSRGVIQPGELTSEDRSSDVPPSLHLHQGIPFTIDAMRPTTYHSLTSAFMSFDELHLHRPTPNCLSPTCASYIYFPP